MSSLGAVSAGVLLNRRFTYAEMVAPLAEPVGMPSVATAAVGMNVTITAVTDSILRISIAAVDEVLDRYFDDGSVAPRSFARPMLTLRTDAAGQNIPWGEYTVRIATKPLHIAVEHPQSGVVQELNFRPDLNQIGFGYNGAPVYGMGPGAHPMNRRGATDIMRNGAGDNLRVFGSRNPIPWLMGKGWGLYFHEPGGQFDLSGDMGLFKPSDSARGQDLYLCVSPTPAGLLRQYAEITGYPHLPAKWTLGFQQSHRTIDSREQIMEEARIFRDKKLPCDALIYLGTGFCPSGWNTGHGSFAFNEAVFPDPEAMIREFHDLHFNVVLHVVNPPENLHGQVTDTGPAASAPSDAANYWQQHVPLIKIGVDGWWPDEGDVLPVASRLVRNRMYWEGGRMTTPNRRPFALHRNCYAGIQRWGWLWSGDTSSTWKTLETQIAMGITAGLSGVPYWGTDIGGFVPTRGVYGRAVCAMVPVWRILSIVSLPRTDLATAPALGMEYGELRPIGDGAECRGVPAQGRRAARCRCRADLPQIPEHPIATNAVLVLRRVGDTHHRHSTDSQPGASVSGGSHRVGDGRWLSLRAEPAGCASV